MNNGNDSSMGIIVGVLVIVVIVIVGFIAYRQGFFKGGSGQTPSTINVKVGGYSNTPTQ